MLPEGLKTISWAAFTRCSALKELVIPASVELIRSSAFVDCPQLTICGVAGSYAEAFAREKNIPFVDR